MGQAAGFNSSAMPSVGGLPPIGGGSSGLPSLGAHKPKSTGLALFDEIEINEDDEAQVIEEK